MVDQNQAAIIASSVLVSTCVILIVLLVYVRQAYRRISEPHSPRDTIKQPDFPPFSPIHKPVQPSLSNKGLEGNVDKYESTPKHSYSRPSGNLETNLDPTQYGLNMNEFYHSNIPRSVKKSSSKSPEHRESNLDLHKHGSLIKHKFSKSSENLDRLEPSCTREHHHHPLTNSVSMNNLNTPFSPPQIQRIKNQHKRTWRNRSSQYRDLSPLLRGISKLHSKGHGGSATSSSSESLDACQSDEKSQPLTDDSELSERPSLGEILVSLCHNPSEGKLTITIKSAEGLQGISKTGKINPFIKIRVYDGGERKYSKKTTIKHDTTSPKFEESFDFVVTRNKMPETSVILRLYHHGHCTSVLSKDVLIGVVFLGYQFELIGPNPFLLDDGARHWASIIEKPHLTIEEWHPIQACSKM